MSESQNIEYKSSWHDDYLNKFDGYTNNVNMNCMNKLSVYFTEEKQAKRKGGLYHKNAGKSGVQFQSD
jgi:hypothetical protein